MPLALSIYSTVFPFILFLTFLSLWLFWSTFLSILILHLLIFKFFFVNFFLLFFKHNFYSFVFVFISFHLFLFLFASFVSCNLWSGKSPNCSYSTRPGSEKRLFPFPTLYCFFLFLLVYIFVGKSLTKWEKWRDNNTK